MKRFILFAIILVLIAAAITYAPHYLARADKPVKSDVIVLLLGSNFTLRKEKVFKLIEDGYARHLIIPAYGKVSDAGLFSNQGTQGNGNPKPDPSLIRGRVVNLPQYPKYFEDTHIEILEAKKMMDKAGFKSAIFVSSPYHMRRISIIANKVFGKNGYRLIYVPSRYEQNTGTLWFLNKRDLKFVSSEYSKIIWFTMYRFLPSRS
jgi:uncharacterized SAM-binding protein YcdF (DUF218 family)